MFWVGGHRYASVTAGAYSVDQDVYMADVLVSSGLTPVFQQAIAEDAKGAAILSALLAFSSATKLRLWAGLVLPPRAPHRWSRTWAARVTRRWVAPPVALLLEQLGVVLTLRTTIVHDFPALLVAPPAPASRLRAMGLLKPVEESRSSIEIRGHRQLGQWDTMVRVLATYNPEDLDRVLRWPLRDALLAFEAQIAKQQREDYQHALQMYVTAAPYAKRTLKPPKKPRLLRG